MKRKRPTARARKRQRPEVVTAVVLPPQTFDEALGALEPRQRLFVREYLIDRNGSAAYKRAGYRAKTDQVATAHASRLAAKGSVSLAIRLGIEGIDAALQSDAEQAVRENMALATSRITDLLSWDGKGELSIRPSGEITERAMACVKSVKRRETKYGPTFEFELHDKGAALERVLRMTGRLRADSAGTALAVQIIVEGTPGLIAAEVVE